jgi:hypothetical protein
VTEGFLRKETPLKRLLGWAGLAFVLHVLWEIGQLPFYQLPPDLGFRAYAVLHCTLGDVLISTLTFSGTAALMRSWDWPIRAPWRGGIPMVTAGVVYTGFSEWHNVYHMAHWTYAPAMPLVAGIGLTPLLQWLLVPSLMLAIVHRHWARQRHI